MDEWNTWLEKYKQCALSRYRTQRRWPWTLYCSWVCRMLSPSRTLFV